MPSKISTLEIFGQRLRVVRISVGPRDVTGFAQKVGIETARYMSLENGEDDPSIHELCNIARATNVSLDYILGKIGPPRPGYQDDGVGEELPPTIH